MLHCSFYLVDKGDHCSFYLVGMGETFGNKTIFSDCFEAQNDHNLDTI